MKGGDARARRCRSEDTDIREGINGVRIWLVRFSFKHVSMECNPNQPAGCTTAPGSDMTFYTPP